MGMDQLKRNFLNEAVEFDLSYTGTGNRRFLGSINDVDLSVKLLEWRKKVGTIPKCYQESFSCP